MKRFITSSLLAVCAGCGPFDYSPDGGDPGSTGEPTQAPPRFATAPSSCPVVQSLDVVNGDVQATLWEQTEDDAFLGSARWTDEGWLRHDATQHRPFHLGSLDVSVAPTGETFAAFYVHDDDEWPELRRRGADGWETLSFEVGLDPERQNFPSVLALGADRALVDIWETGGGPPARQRAFLYGQGTWTAVEPYRPQEDRRTFHRGPAGQLWRATMPKTLPGSITFDEWAGTGWTPLDLGIDVTTPGYLRALGFHDDRAVALYDTTRFAPGGHGFELYEVGAPSTLIGISPSTDLWTQQLDFAPDGRVLVTASGFEEDLVVLRTMRLDADGWHTVHEARARKLLRGTSRVVGQELVVGWTETSETIDTGFQHYTDCTLRFERAPL